MKRTSILAAALLASSLLSTAAWAGPFNDFEAQARTAYAGYRAALFQTNKNDKAATEEALNGLSTKWTALIAQWGKAPPPQYVDDAKFVGTLDSVSKIIDTAKAETAKNELAKAHETLEKIRDELAALRERNGVIVFSDRMNAYHSKMEEVLAKNYNGFDAAGLAALREDAAVLAYLYTDIAARPPADGVGKDDFKQALGAFKNSVDAVVAASRGTDAAAAKKAVDSLKGPYSMLFLKFG